MRIGFLLNHYAVHQVPHAVPYAFELSRRNPGFEVVIGCSTKGEREVVEAIASLYPGHRCEIATLSPPKIYDLVDPIVSKWSFMRKEMVLANNLDFFRSLDAIVAPERNCMKLRTRYGLDLKMIHTRHGAGDREGGFDSRSGAFDLTLLPGQKYVDRLTELGHLAHERYAVTGWPKFEVVKSIQKPNARFFDNDNPTIVYNPHFDQNVSSWRDMGVEVLDWFVEHPEYNLIFAPHTVLFKRSRRHKAALPRRFHDVPNIHVDTGSTASADMTYIQAADVYLGDVSSQVYEFLLEPRPCIFLNGHGVDWKDNGFYFHWTLGQVVDDLQAELGNALEQADAMQELYEPRQREAFAYTFRMEDGSTAAQRGADAIADYMLREQANRARHGASAPNAEPLRAAS